jgi:hypothetical protein
VPIGLDPLVRPAPNLRHSDHLASLASHAKLACPHVAAWSGLEGEQQLPRVTQKQRAGVSSAEFVPVVPANRGAAHPGAAVAIATESL